MVTIFVKVSAISVDVDVGVSLSIRKNEYRGVVESFHLKDSQ